jgi:LacI family transcriptional regulator
MQDVALAAGVSASTVANVLSRPDIVAADTRRRVEDAMRAVGYVPSGVARRLRNRSSRVVGSIILDVSNPFYAELNRGIEDRLAETGGLLIACSTDVREDRERQLLQVLEQQAVRGIIVAPTSPRIEALLEVSRRGTPVVLVDHPRPSRDLCAVTVDHELGGRLVGEHLLSLGHTVIAFLTGVGQPDSVLRRRAGLRSALAAAGLDPDRSLLDLQVPVVYRDVMGTAVRSVEQTLRADPRPTALVCVNDTAAVAVMKAGSLVGLRIPAELSVVGYDDLQFTAWLTPALTTVRQPKRELGLTAADLLLDEARQGHRHRQVRLEPELVVRGSTTAPA